MSDPYGVTVSPHDLRIVVDELLRRGVPPVDGYDGHASNVRASFCSLVYALEARDRLVEELERAAPPEPPATATP